MESRSLVRTVRQHHAIEHATVTLLSRSVPGITVAAHSDPRGFTVYGDVSREVLRTTVEEALARLQAGESSLALHPNCGTNLVTAGVLSGLAALFAGSGRNRSLWDRVPSAILGATAALLVAVPLGRWMQENVTTSSQVDGLRLVSVTRLTDGPVPRHRVTLAG